jgi:hypothetical protein
VKMLSVVGAHPQFVKPAPIAWQLARHGDAHPIVHTRHPGRYLIVPPAATPDDPDRPAAVAGPRRACKPPTPFADGKAAVRIIDELASRAHDELMPIRRRVAGRLRQR